MATLTVSLSFLSSAQGFTGFSGFASALSWDGTTGNPLGSLKTITSGSAASDNTHWGIVTTYESLGVPTNSLITGITAGSLDSRCTAFASGTGCTSGACTLVDGAITATLSAQRSFGATDASFVHTTGTDLTGINTPSSNSVTLSIPNHIGTTSGGSGKGVTLFQDNLNFTLTYVPATGRSAAARIPGRSPGQIGRPGPMPPGLSRFRPRIQVVSQTSGAAPLSPSAAMAATEHNDAQSAAGAFATAATLAATSNDSMAGGALRLASQTGVAPRLGSTVRGEIGRPGPMPPGLSRFRPRIQVAAQSTQGSPQLISVTMAATDGHDLQVSAGTFVVGAAATLVASADDVLAVAGRCLVNQIGVAPRLGSTVRGQVGRPGPMLPGLSRFRPFAQIAAQSAGLPGQGAAGSMAVTSASSTLAGAAIYIADTYGLKPPLGSTVRGQIGLAGPLPPGLSRFRPFLQVAAQSSGTPPTFGLFLGRNDAITAFGTFRASAAIGGAEAHDSGAIAGLIPPAIATSSPTESRDTPSMSGAMSTHASLASVSGQSDLGHIVASLGAAASLSLTAASDSASASGAFRATGSLATTGSGDAATVSATFRVTTIIASASRDDVSGSVANFTTSAATAFTERRDNLAGGSSPVATAAIGQVFNPDDSGTSFGTFATSVQLGATESHDSLSANASIEGFTFLASTERRDTMAASSSLVAFATLSGTSRADVFGAFNVPFFQIGFDPEAATILPVRKADPTKAYFNPYLARVTA